jgi:hypothetical protein
MPEIRLSGSEGGVAHAILPTPIAAWDGYAASLAALASALGMQYGQVVTSRHSLLKQMPYWSIYCLYCGGFIADALLECVPAARQREAAYLLLAHTQPGAALACPYCNGLLGFDQAGQPQPPQTGWPVFRYGRAELEIKKQDDGVAASTSLGDWALQYRFLRPGTHLPLSEYTYAEQAPPHETVP